MKADQNHMHLILQVVPHVQDNEKPMKDLSMKHEHYTLI